MPLVPFKGVRLASTGIDPNRAMCGGSMPKSAGTQIAVHVGCSMLEALCCALLPTGFIWSCLRARKWLKQTTMRQGFPTLNALAKSSPFRCPRLSRTRRAPTRRRRRPVQARSVNFTKDSCQDNVDHEGSGSIPPSSSPHPALAYFPHSLSTRCQLRTSIDSSQPFPEGGGFGRALDGLSRRIWYCLARLGVYPVVADPFPVLGVFLGPL